MRKRGQGTNKRKEMRMNKMKKRGNNRKRNRREIMRTIKRKMMNSWKIRKIITFRRKIRKI